MLSPLTLQVKMINRFVIGSIPKLRHILEQTNELTKLSIQNTNSIETESIGNLINIVSISCHSLQISNDFEVNPKSQKPPVIYWFRVLF